MVSLSRGRVGPAEEVMTGGERTSSGALSANCQYWTPDVSVLFTNVTSTVSSGGFFFSRDKKEILHGVSGEFRSGELTAIMGPSGAGKSTLLNILAGFKEDGFSGEVRVEGAGRRCYIMQEESLHPLLTVSEIMSIAASLKLGCHIIKKQKQYRVNEILNSLGLMAHVHTRTANLSGGQRKRLGIALELLDNPKVIFIDEPTSGLDSSSTKHLLRLLHDLAREGRVVVCTIHQPSSNVFSDLDQVYFLAGGYCAFTGSPHNILTYLAGHDLHCPPYHSPADFMLEVCSGDYGDHVQALSTSCQNGKVHEWKKPAISPLQAEDRNSTLHVGPRKKLFEIKILEIHPVVLELVECGYSYPTSFFKQTFILVKRKFITLTRDPFLTHSRFLIHISISLLLGIFFYDIGCDAGMVFSNYNVLFFSILFLSFTALQSMTISFPLEVPIIRKEHFNCWYSVKAFYLASNLADLPIQVACVLLFCTILYWMSGQPMEWLRFGMFTFMAIMSSLLAQTTGYLVGASMDVMNGVVFGPMSILPWVLFSGFFLMARDCPEWARWIYTISWLRRGIEGLTASVYGYQRGTLPCLSEDYCHFVSPKKFLEELGMEDDSFGFNVLFLFIMCLALKLITYGVLKYQLKTR